MAARVQAPEVREVPVVRLDFLELVAPFEELSLAADRVRTQPGRASRSCVAEGGIDAQGLGRIRDVREQVAHQRQIHRRAGRDRPALAADLELVLGRRRRRGDEVALAVVDEPVEAELGGAAQHRIRRVAQPGEVAAEQVVLVEVLRQPRPGHRPRGPHRVAVAPVADHARVPPEVGVVVRRPAARAVHRRRGARAVHRQLTDERQQRLVQLGEVGRFRRPVVHLRVDVDRVVRAPRRPDVFVPDALEVGRLRAGPARRDQQVAAVLEEQLDEFGSAARGGDPAIGRRILWAPGVQLQRHAIEQRAMVGDVGVAQGPRTIGLPHATAPRSRRPVAAREQSSVEAVERRGVA